MEYWNIARTNDKESKKKPLGTTFGTMEYWKKLKN